MNDPNIHDLKDFKNKIQKLHTEVEAKIDDIQTGGKKIQQQKKKVKSLTKNRSTKRASPKKTRKSVKKPSLPQLQTQVNSNQEIQAIKGQLLLIHAQLKAKVEARRNGTAPLDQSPEAKKEIDRLDENLHALNAQLKAKRESILAGGKKATPRSHVK